MVDTHGVCVPTADRQARRRGATRRRTISTGHCDERVLQIRLHLDEFTKWRECCA